MCARASKPKLPPFAPRRTSTSTCSGRVTPSIVRSPITRAVLSSIFSTEVDLKAMTGKCSELRNAGPRSVPLKDGEPTSTEAVSTVKATRLSEGRSKLTES